MQLPYGNEKAEGLARMLDDAIAFEEGYGIVWPAYSPLAVIQDPGPARIAEAWDPTAWRDVRDEVMQQARRRQAVPPREAR